MIAKDQNIALIILGNLAQKNPRWIDYANYCFNREKGLRKVAFGYLNAFLETAKKWDFEQKKEFVSFLFPLFESVEDADYGGFPQPLKELLIKPALVTWCENEKIDNNPFRWFGEYYYSEEHILKALELNSSDDLARKIVISRWLGNIYFSIHHLPEGYIGCPYEDIKLGAKIKEQILLLSPLEAKEYWSNQLEEDLEIIQNYIDWEISEHPNFEKWGVENKRRVGYGLQHYYYKK